MVENDILRNEPSLGRNIADFSSDYNNPFSVLYKEKDALKQSADTALRFAAEYAYLSELTYLNCKAALQLISNDALRYASEPKYYSDLSNKANKYANSARHHCFKNKRKVYIYYPLKTPYLKERII